MQSLVDTEQLMTLLAEDKDIVDRPNAVNLEIDPDKGEGGYIEFRDVNFSYDGKKDVLKGISFKVEKGQSVALVGSSGGGKSTVMRLLYRFYEATTGGIYVNGHDIRDLTQQSLRFNIGIVPQESVLFNETIRYNIAYGGIGRLNRPTGDITMEDVVEAAKDSSMHDKIMSFPDQYETRVGERGMRLSGGEKQRVAIARTILKNPPSKLLPKFPRLILFRCPVRLTLTFFFPLTLLNTSITPTLPLLLTTLITPVLLLDEASEFICSDPLSN